MTSLRKTMKLAIVGTRNPGVSYAEWEQILLSKISIEEVEMIVSGGAKGVDTFAKIFAGRHHILIMEFLPEYSKFGRNATLRRNTQIVREASVVVAFPSPESRGTFHSIKEAQRLGKRLFVITIPSKNM